MTLQPTDYVTKAGGLIQQAQSAEDNGNLSVALAHYEQALSLFNLILQNKQCVYLAETITRYAEKCLARAQQLRESLRTGISMEKPSIASNVNSSSSSSSSSSTDERQGMLQQLSMTRIEPGQYSVTWDDIIGMESVKKFLDDTLKLPREMPHLFTGNREVPRSVLLYGPPGTGKTLMGKALACVSGVPFYAVSSAELISKYVGESEKSIKCLFELVKSEKPCILFLDEVEALCGKREESNKDTKTVQQFLTQLDGITNTGSMDGVFVLACTNLPWSLDEAMRRRFEHRIYVPLPQLKDRQAMLRYYVEKNAHSVSVKEYAEIASKTEYFSADDIKQLCKRASMVPIKVIEQATHFEVGEHGELVPSDAKNPLAFPMSYSQVKEKAKIVEPPVSYAHLLEALKQTKSSVDVNNLAEYERWTVKFGSVY